jgi:ankyrin repeat protein
MKRVSVGNLPCDVAPEEDHNNTPPTNVPLSLPYNPTDGLMLAAKAGDLNRVKELVAAGADINEQYCEISEFMHIHMGEGSSNAALMLASLGGHYEVVEYLLDNGVGYASNRALSLGVNDNSDGYFGEGPLSVAVHFNHIEVAKLLLSRGANPNEMACFKKGSLIFIAAGNGNIDMAKMLLDQGANY